MKKRIINVLGRGMLCGGFGPLVYAIIMVILYYTNVDTQVDGLVIFKGVVSTYLLAFIVAGSSVIWQEEKMGIALQLAIHGLALYLSYLLTYLINGWISSNVKDFLIFTAIFFGGYALIWVIIMIVEKNRTKNLNKQLK